MGGFHVEFLDVNVTLQPDKSSAVVEMTVKGQISGDRDLLVEELKLRLTNLDGEWLIDRAETKKTF